MPPSKTAKKDIIAINLNKAKVTKGAVMYATDADGARITNLYIRKEAFADGNFPEEITVTVSA